MKDETISCNKNYLMFNSLIKFHLRFAKKKKKKKLFEIIRFKWKLPEACVIIIIIIYICIFGESACLINECYENNIRSVSNILERSFLWINYNRNNTFFFSFFFPNNIFFSFHNKLKGKLLMWKVLRRKNAHKWYKVLIKYHNPIIFLLGKFNVIFI